jgi:hypothetical protein
MGISVRSAAWLLGLVSTVSAFGCVSAQRVDTTQGQTNPREACFDIRTTDSFSPLHGMFVYARAQGGQQYLLTLDTIYVDLPNATGFTISGTFGQVCSYTGATLTFSDFGRRASARIIKVESVPSKEAAQELVEARTAQRR